MTDLKELKLMANTIRKDLIEMLLEAKSGHSAGPLGMADVFAVLYFNILNYNPKNPEWKERDRLILSNGHIVPVRYAAMAEAGFFPKEELKTLRKLGTRLQGHPHDLALPGLESTSGPLGQGTSIAAGVALAAKMDKKDFHVICLAGDGEINEGQAWEAFMFAAKNKLDNLIYVIDRNFIQIDGNTEGIMPLDPLNKKFEAFNFHVIELDGNNIKELIKGFEKAKTLTGKPICIIANTVPGKGVSFMENKFEWHGMPPNKEQAEKALKELNETEEKIKAGN
ncbi:MAG: transketolase [Candidatus Diapherotrites archaeon CG10_big_fil_rev_8_21_14_0_10_31_34]|nr:MAG: transketolase [Candidatus Diapherotrites archaeon CG10_big_fil_rev_8_21_14_0_10_31_34]